MDTNVKLSIWRVSTGSIKLATAIWVELQREMMMIKSMINWWTLVAHCRRDLATHGLKPLTRLILLLSSFIVSPHLLYIWAIVTTWVDFGGEPLEHISLMLCALLCTELDVHTQAPLCLSQCVLLPLSLFCQRYLFIISTGNSPNPPYWTKA